MGGCRTWQARATWKTYAQRKSMMGRFMHTAGQGTLEDIRTEGETWMHTAGRGTLEDTC